MRTSLETTNNKVKLYTDECTEASRVMLSTEIETLRTRIQEVNESTNDLEIQFAELQTESKDQMTKSGKEAEGREKLLEAKIEDLSDRLRLGMGKLQQAIGESSASVKGKLATIDVSLGPLGNIFSVLSFCFSRPKSNWKTLRVFERKSAAR